MLGFLIIYLLGYHLWETAIHISVFTMLSCHNVYVFRVVYAQLDTQLDNVSCSTFPSLSLQPWGCNYYTSIELLKPGLQNAAAHPALYDKLSPLQQSLKKVPGGWLYLTLTRKVCFACDLIPTFLQFTWLMFITCFITWLSNFSQPCLEIEIGLQADERSETIHTAKREDACNCSSLHVQGMFTYTDSHRCPLHKT